jgi:hypothetical protein
MWTTDLFAHGNISCVVLTERSDARLKEKIHTIENALDTVTKLRGVHYEWIDKELGEGLQVGLIAQEIEKVFPELVAQEDEGIKSVSYSHLVGVLIEAIKELKLESDSAK